MKTGIELIKDERERQVSQEGWTAGSDDKHQPEGQLALAAACYALPERVRNISRPGLSAFLHMFWPWHEAWWKPTPNDRVRELVKAGALIAAEIDRLQRKCARPSAQGE